MPVGIVETKADEKKWKRAKKLAAKQGHGEDYGYITSIYKNLKGIKSAVIHAPTELLKSKEGRADVN